jgi:putative endonuclease
MWYVYILESQKNHSLYTGSTCDLERRLWEHNNSTKTHSFTYKNRPYTLAFSEQYSTKEEAMRREKYLKIGVGRKELAKLISNF